MSSCAIVMVNFRINDPPFLISELQLQRNNAKTDSGLATTLKIGAWGHTGHDDQRFANDGTLLADPSGSGQAATHKGNYGIYAMVDQQLYRPKGGDLQSGVSVFHRISFSPNDRNLVGFFADGGFVFAGLIPGRPEDKFGASIMYSKYSNSVRGYERDSIAFSGMPGTVRDYEANLELTYRAEIVPGWTVQPNLQVIWHPDGGATKRNRDRSAIAVEILIFDQSSGASTLAARFQSSDAEALIALSFGDS